MGILEVKNVGKRFGGLQALGDVNLSVAENSVHAIIGPNGAGKSTLLNCFVGKLIPDTGSVMFDGQSVLGRSPHEINQMGISRVFQTPEIFADLSVMENMMIPCFAKRDGAFEMNAISSIGSQKDILERAEHMLEDMNMADKQHMHAGSLSRGDKRRLEIGMCLSQEPRLLLLDEPTAGMARADTNNTIDLLKQIKDTRDITIAIIEHDMHVVFSLAERITVLAQGTPLVEDTPENIKGHPKVREAYLGESATRLKRTHEMNVKPDFSKNANMASTAPAFLSVWDMHAYYGESYIVQGISFNVHEGEILALLGRNGAGKTSTLRSIARLGDPQVTHGEIWLDHQPLHKMSSHEAASVGLGLVVEDRRIIQGLTVEENLKLAQIAPPVGWSLERIYDLFPRLGERKSQEGTTLSGGEQQMLSIARALARDLKVLLLDEPYEGLAPVIVDEIEKTLIHIKEQGMTTVIVEQNAVRALELADRAVILDTGGIVFDGTAAEVLENAELRAEYLAI